PSATSDQVTIGQASRRYSEVPGRPAFSSSAARLSRGPTGVYATCFAATDCGNGLPYTAVRTMPAASIGAAAATAGNQAPRAVRRKGAQILRCPSPAIGKLLRGRGTREPAPAAGDWSAPAQVAQAAQATTVAVRSAPSGRTSVARPASAA